MAEIVIKGMDKVLRKIQDPKKVASPRFKFLAQAGAVLVTAVKERTPVDRGHARNSIDMQVGSNFVKISSDLEYINALEEGSRPHWPPKGALQPWAKRHGFPPGSVGDFLVRRAISQKGTPANHMFRDGLAASRVKIHALAESTGGAVARVMGQ